jgi:penicillin amidase
LNTTILKRKGKARRVLAISKSVALLDNSPIPPFIGRNNSWFITKKKLKWKSDFANDPHIGFSQPGHE